MLNGNVGVMKSMMAEITDETNMARGFALIPVVWAVGGTIGFGISLPSFVLSLISRLIGPSLVVYYHDPKITGQLSSRILFGENTHISCHALPLRHMLLYHFLLLLSS
jgi:hypothetical protein